MLRKFLSTVGQDPHDSKSNQLHVDIFWFRFIHSRHILAIPLKWLVILLKSRTSTGYFLAGANQLVHPVIPWRQGFRHPTTNECMGWFAQISILKLYRFICNQPLVLPKQWILVRIHPNMKVLVWYIYLNGIENKNIVTCPYPIGFLKKLVRWSSYRYPNDI